MNATVILLPAILAWSHCASTRFMATDASLRALRSVVLEFERVCGRLPTEEEGLEVLVRKPVDWPDGVLWESFLAATDIPPDGWGNEFIYVLAPVSADGFGIYSCGEDGVTTSGGNDRDDLNTWNAESPWRAYYDSRLRRIELTPSGAAGAAIFVLVITVIAGFLWRVLRTGTMSEP
jgi:type II secretion system protein G